MIPYLQKLAQYDAWANQQICSSVGSVPKESPPAARAKVATLLAHLAAAKGIWLNRISGKAAGSEIWPTLELDAAEKLLFQADRDFVEVTAKLTLAELTRPVIYRTSRGQSHATPLVDVVTHVINHGTYHRGQMANAIAGAGGQASTSDYIEWVRR